MKYMILLLGILSAFSCQSNQDRLLKQMEARKTINKNGLIISDSLLIQLEKEIGQLTEPFNREVWKYDEQGNEDHYFLKEGVFFNFIAEDRAHEIFKKYSDKIRATGNLIFLTEMDFDEEYNTYYDIVIINCKDQFQLVSLIGTDGVNYDIYNTDIVKKLKEWGSEIDLTLEVVDVDRVQGYFKHLPSPPIKFTREVYAFCPDVIEQGYGDMEQMVSDYKANKYLWLWWD